MAKSKPKYAARFENFFPNLRLNRAEFADMAAFTLAALQGTDAARYAPLISALDGALTTYRSNHAGQLSGEGQSATLTLAQVLSDLKAYVKKVERKFIVPNYDAGSPDLKALLPHGRSGLTKSNQSTMEDAFTAFLNGLDARPTVFTSPIRTEGRAVLTNLQRALHQSDTTAKKGDTRRLDLHDGRLDTCVLLFRIYATLLLEFFENPAQVSAYFDLSKAYMGGKKNKPALLPNA